MKMSKRIIVGLLALLFILAGCASNNGTNNTDHSSNTSQDQNDGEEAAKTTVRVGSTTDVTTFDPSETIGSYDTVPMLWVYDTLLDLNQENQPSPSLATDWEQISDTQWQFDLRDDVYFTDGTQMTGEVVKFCLERASLSARSAAFSGFIDHVEVVDDFRIIIHTKYPYGATLMTLCDPRNSIYSMEAFEANGGAEGLATTPVGSGAWKLEEFVLGDHSTYVYNENYWGEKPAITRIEWKIIPEESTRLVALQNGGLDLIYSPSANEISNIEASENMKMIFSSRARTVYLGLNAKSEQLSDVNLRTAIAMGIDTDLIVDTILEGTQRKIDGNGLYPPEILTAERTFSGYAPEAAKAALAESDYNGEAITFYCPEDRYMRDAQVGEVIQQMLNEIGIAVDLQIVEFGTLTDLLGSGDNVMCLYGWGFSTMEPYTGMSQLLLSDSVLNYYGFDDPEADQMFSDAVAMSDLDAANELYEEITWRAVEEQHCIVPLYYMNNMWACSSDLNGVWIMPNELVNFDNASFE